MEQETKQQRDERIFAVGVLLGSFAIQANAGIPNGFELRPSLSQDAGKVGLIMVNLATNRYVDVIARDTESITIDLLMPDLMEIEEEIRTLSKKRTGCIGCTDMNCLDNCGGEGGGLIQ